VRELRKIWVVPAATFILFGCSDDSGPSGPKEPEPVVAEEIQLDLLCEVQVANGTFGCARLVAPGGDRTSQSIFADPNALVHLEATNVKYEAGVFSAYVAVRSNLMQPLGTADGTEIDANGVRVFLAGDPEVTGGSGTVGVRNADGVGELDGSDHPYYQYDQAIAPAATSLPKLWELDVPATVESFTFPVAVYAKVIDKENLTAGLNFNVTRVAADSLHTCVLSLDGQPWCWGSGGSGRLGNRGVLQESLPVATVTGGEQFVTLEAGLAHTCGITVKGEAWCWGSGGDGRLGNGGTAQATTPSRVFGTRTYAQMTVGRTHTCALDTEGRAWCWGGGANGKLGNGSTNPAQIPGEVLGGLQFIWLSAGSYHTCGVSTTGQAYCWGSATNGKRGDGVTSGTTSEPGLVSGGHTFAKIYAGEQHSCALTPDGEAWCWGSNAQGQLGTGDYTSSAVPVQVTGGHRFVTMALGFDYTCAVEYSGKAYCWGANDFGKLGHDNVADVSVPTPTEVVGVEGFTGIGAGIHHTCGVTVAGEVYCWGTAETGRLGTGSLNDTPVPTRVTSLSGIAFLGAPPASCSAAEGAASACFRRRSLQERVELAVVINDLRASILS